MICKRLLSICKTWDREEMKKQHILYKIKDPDAKTFIVVASFVESKTTSCYKLKDTWSSHEEIESARIRYNDYLKRDDLYSASICKVIVSTDYD